MNSNQPTYAPIPQQQYQQQQPQQQQYQPQFQTQPQYQVYQPQYQAQQPLLYVQPVTCHTPVNDCHRNDENSALICLIVGFFFSIIWLGGFWFIRSPSKTARIYAYVSIALFFTALVIVVICLSVILTAVSTIPTTYSYDNNYSYSSYN